MVDVNERVVDCDAIKDRHANVRQTDKYHLSYLVFCPTYPVLMLQVLFVDCVYLSLCVCVCAKCIKKRKQCAGLMTPTHPSLYAVDVLH